MGKKSQPLIRMTSRQWMYFGGASNVALTGDVACRSCGDLLEHSSELLDQPDVASLARVEARDQITEVDTRGEPEGGRYVFAQLHGVQGTVGVEGQDDGTIGVLPELCETDLITQSRHMTTECDLVYLPLENLEAGDLRDQVHNAILTAHQLTEAKRRVKV